MCPPTSLSAYQGERTETSPHTRLPHTGSALLAIVTFLCPPAELLISAVKSLKFTQACVSAHVSIPCR